MGPFFSLFTTNTQGKKKKKEKRGSGGHRYGNESILTNIKDRQWGALGEKRKRRPENETIPNPEVSCFPSSRMYMARGREKKKGKGGGSKPGGEEGP